MSIEAIARRVDALIHRQMSSANDDGDQPITLELCNLIRLHGPDIVLDQLKTNLKHGTPEVQVRALNVLNQCVLNSGQNVMIALSSEKWCERFFNVAKSSKSDVVRDCVIRQLLLWYAKFRTNGLEQCLGRFSQHKGLKEPFLRISRGMNEGVSNARRANDQQYAGQPQTPPDSPLLYATTSSAASQRSRATTMSNTATTRSAFQDPSQQQQQQQQQRGQQQYNAPQRQQQQQHAPPAQAAHQRPADSAEMSISNLETFIMDAQGDLASLEYGLSHPEMLDRSIAIDCQQHKKEVGRKVQMYLDIMPPQYSEALMRLLENLSNALESYEMFSGEDLGEGGLTRLKSYGAPAFAQMYATPSRKRSGNVLAVAQGAASAPAYDDDEGGDEDRAQARSNIKKASSLVDSAQRQAVEAQEEASRLISQEREQLLKARQEISTLRTQTEELQAKYKEAKNKNKKALAMITESTTQIEELEERIAELESGSGAAAASSGAMPRVSSRVIEKVVERAPHVDAAVVRSIQHNVQVLRRDLHDIKTAALPDWKREFLFMASQVQGSVANIFAAAQSERAGEAKALQWAQDLYRKEMKLRKQYYNQIQELKGNIRVYCRARPMSDKELSDGHTCVASFPSDDELRLVDGTGRVRMFEFDMVYGPDTSQVRVFEDTAPLIDSVVDGYNVCIFAYGQTGSGKTFTMNGYQEKGINKRALDRLFHIIDERKESEASTVHVSVLEIYCEQIRDLLVSRSEASRQSYDVKTGGPYGNYVTNLREFEVTSAEEIDSVMDKAASNRSEGKTDMNAHSSRSHMILYVLVRTRNLHTGVQSYGKLSLVDLAGSERLDKSGSEGQAAKEAVAINKSLSALGDVIAGLSNTGQKHIPFRNSILTFLLQDSMAGQAKVLMFCCISPASYNVSESSSSLQFATRARGVSLGQAKKNIVAN